MPPEWLRGLTPGGVCIMKKNETKEGRSASGIFTKALATLVTISVLLLLYESGTLVRTTTEVAETNRWQVASHSDEMQTPMTSWWQTA